MSNRILSKLGLRRKQKPGQTADKPDILSEEDERERVLASQGPMITDHQSDTNPIRSEYLATRVLLVICGVLATTTIIESLCLVELVPMHTVMPYFVTFQDSSNQIVSIAPPTASISSMSIIMDKEVRSYMGMRYEVLPDKESNIYRWNTRLKILSSSTVYDAFQQEIEQTKQKIEKQPGYSRQIVIKSVLALGTNANSGTYQVDFDLLDKAQASGLNDAVDHESHWTAIIKVAMFPQKVPRSLLGLNPFGFKVIGYSVTQRQN